MARAVNQTIAWIVSVLLSAIVFAGLLGLVFMVAPKRNHSGHDSGEVHSASAHGEGDHESNHADSNNKGHEAAHAKDEVHETLPSAPASSQPPPTDKAGSHEAEEEISADAFKKPKEQEHEKAPH